MARLKELERENARLKKMYAESQMMARCLKKSKMAILPLRGGQRICS